MVNTVTITYDISDEIFSNMQMFFKILQHIGIRTYELRRLSLDELRKGPITLIAKAYEMYGIREIKLIRKAILDGQKILLMLDGDSAPFFDSSQAILGDCGILISSHIVKKGSESFVVTRNINKKHIAMQGIKELTMKKPKVLFVQQRKINAIDVLFRSEREHDPSEAILAVVCKHGNGRVAVISSWSLIDNELIRKSDNAIFAIVFIYWLIGRKAPNNLLDMISAFIQNR